MVAYRNSGGHLQDPLPEFLVKIKNRRLVIILAPMVVFSPTSQIFSPFAATNLFGDVFALEFDTCERSFRHHMARSSRVHNDSDFHPHVLRFNDFFLSSNRDCSPHSTVTHDWLYSPLFVSSAAQILPHLIFTFCQLLIIVRCFFNVFTVIFTNGVQNCVAFRHRAAMCPVLPQIQHALFALSFVSGHCLSATNVFTWFASLLPWPPWYPFSVQL